MESTRLININNINDMKVGDNIIVNRSFMSQKYFDTPYEEDIKHVEGIVSMINYNEEQFVLNNNMIDFETKSVITFIQKRVPVIIID